MALIDIKRYKGTDLYKLNARDILDAIDELLCVYTGDNLIGTQKLIDVFNNLKQIVEQYPTDQYIAFYMGEPELRDLNHLWKMRPKTLVQIVKDK
jgi:hypothetical protein